ncbi:MAG: sodium:solute symporter family protein [Myxococcales bacterium]|jgi:SSS family solute:Na+ symporter/sodium/pantothenate symporter
MPEAEPLLSGDGYAVVALYLLVLVSVGIAGRLARRDDSLSDFYLGGRSLGPLVLFLTLYATQYSGLTLVGFAGNAYRSGFSFLVAVTFGCSIIGGYLIIAPRLQALSARRGYVTVGDYVQDRYGSRALTFTATGIFVFALAAYILSNLKAIGYVVHAATGGAVGFAEGIVVLSVLMVAYETLGGLRAVAWTDVVQGLILLLGCVAIFVAVGMHYGSPAENAALLLSHSPAKWQPPDLAGKLGWASTLLLVCFGVSIYPHAIQRIYAARDATVLRRSLSLMLLMPFFTTLLMLLIGILGAARFPGLGKDDSEQIVLHVLSDVASTHAAVGALVVVLVCAMIAAIMSTVDSALLAVASLVTEDLYAHLRPGTPQARLTRLGKRFSWALMAAMAWLAIELPQTLWRLTEIKLEVLCQMAPAIFLGLHTREVTAGAVLRGLWVGLGLTLVFLLGDMLGLGLPRKPLGLHAGAWGLLANFATVLLATSRRRGAMMKQPP